ncbi:MAG: chemotaxis protein CheW [Desulfuromonadales bacterium]|nr:chemotaxis protein CheW [Desulfuromonadales bacterium]
MSVSGIIETLQYLTLKLGEEVFALDVAKVREILELTTITKVPQTPEYMRGVINLRGSVVPVIDMRLMFGMSRTEQTVNTCIVVVEVSLDNQPIVLGALADSVQEVVELDPDRIEPAPHIGTKLNTNFIRGMCEVDGSFVMILDIDTVFSSDDMISLSQAGGQRDSGPQTALYA